MSYDAKEIANYFLDKAKSDSSTIAPMQMQKLVYISHGYHLAFVNQPLIDSPVGLYVGGLFAAVVSLCFFLLRVETVYVCQECMPFGRQRLSSEFYTSDFFRRCQTMYFNLGKNIKI
ncbi:putative phage-associated protein [Fuerstiella marisgermanici]|uniref:Putative phage-associated protein n=1 Tax=Fuerstiella marisgermanici TaxID=1891926 RepID=A0A1P8WDL9_9PLAN|nr:putative phage-associated protein [Fuerstiella marisgermanici]